MLLKRGFMVNSIKKRIISFIVAGTFILLPGKGKTELDGIDDLAYNTKEVYVYDRDSLNGERLGTLKVNQDFIRILSGVNLDLINYKNHLGFIDKNIIESYSFPESNIKYQEIEEYGYTKTDVNMRVGTGTNYDKIIMVPHGIKLDLIAISDNNWYLVDYNNILGFINGEYITILNSNKIEEDILKLPKVKKEVMALTDVNIRESNDVNSKKLGLLKKNRKIQFNKLIDGWYQVEHNGYIGYVKSDYVKEIYYIDSNYSKIVYLKNDSYVYNKPYETIIDVLDKYEICYIYGEIEDYFLAESEGRVFYVEKCNCKELKDSFIIVDISS